MKKIFNVIIIFTLLIIIGINEVDAKKMTCSCYGTSDGVEFSFYFNIDSSDFTNPEFTVTVDGKQLGKVGECQPGSHGCGTANWYQISNFYEPIVNVDYSYLADYMANQSCPAYGIYIKSDEDYFFVSDEAHGQAIKASAGLNMFKYTSWGTEYTAKGYIVPCTMTYLEEDTPPPEEVIEEEEEEEEDEGEHPGVGEGGRIEEDDDKKYKCGVVNGKATMKNFPAAVPRITRFIYNFLQVLVPIAIIILGSIDLVKAISAQKEDEIKKGQQMLIKRLITSVIVFFVFALVKLLVSVVSDNSQGIVDCINCFLTNDTDKYCVE